MEQEEQYYTLLDSENGIGACMIQKIPASIRLQFGERAKELSKVVWFHDKDRDLVILNRENPDYECHKEFVQRIIGMSDEAALELIEQTDLKESHDLANYLIPLLKVRKWRSLNGGRHDAEE